MLRSLSSPGDHTDDEIQALAGPARDAATVERTREAIRAWKEVVAKYQEPNAWRASWQLLNTIGSYVGLWCLMYFTVGVSWWLTIPLAVLAGGLLVRVFIIFHDCGHGSFLASRAANDFWGFVTGVLTF